MGRCYEEVSGSLAAFILAQPMFFVATAPLSADGHVNCSPKSNNGELAVVDGLHVAYLDRTGSGTETIAHLAEPGNGRIVLMFCAFAGPPRIVRLHGLGEVVLRDSPAFAHHASRFREESLLGARSVVVTEIERISDSCGYGVPLMDFQRHRPQADAWHARRGEDGVRRYWLERNLTSIDGLPGVPDPAP